jgi:hypothetical protein
VGFGDLSGRRYRAAQRQCLRGAAIKVAEFGSLQGVDFIRDVVADPSGQGGIAKFQQRATNLIGCLDDRVVGREQIALLIGYLRRRKDVENGVDR